MTATVVSATQITVSWQASTDSGSGVAGYRVYRDGGATPVASVSVTTYTDTALSPSTQYRYAVRAYDRANPANESATSAEATATTDAVAAASGLDTRPDNTTCVAGERPSQSVALATQRAFPSLPFLASPVLAVQAPGNGSRWFVVEQAGVVRAFANQASVSNLQVFIDITGRVTTGGERGLLGMAFHPNFPTDPRVYLSYTTGGANLVSRISEFRTIDGGATLDPSSEKVILTVNQPAENHNGGNIAFGPDGFLYVGFGDGGSGGDPWGSIGNGQNLQTLLGKMLRIDIGGTTGSVPYRIPAGNPYAANPLCSAGTGTQSCPEIYAYGFRNPWRWSFDRGSGELWVGDVGQGNIEEVDRVVAGGNYGWRCFEGTNPYNSTCGPNAGASLPPIAQYDHTVGQAITGGYVYRGSAIPALVGRYVFGDWASGRVWQIPRDTTPTLTVTTGFDSGIGASSFGEGADGELYLVDYYGGQLYKLIPAAGTGGGTIASQLSATGCVLPNDATQPATGLIPYAPNAPFWSDGAVKDRYLALPNGATLSVDAAGDVQFPNGTVLMKNFTLAGRRVETRLLMRHTDGEWAGYTYEWNAQGTDATRVVGGKTATVNGQTWVFPSETQCLACHTAAAGRNLGLEIAQLNGDLLYPQTGRTANQVTTLDAIGLFSPPIATPPASLPAYRNPYGTAGTLTERARAWLHTNCAQCHRPGGGTPVNLDLRYDTALSATNTCNAVPQAGDLGIANARIIATGDAARSVLVARANRRDANAMPPLGSTVVDTAGVALLTNWVNSLTSCN
ncbi:MAG: PQQ-dependent sugar dehydrogenase [Steroidobacteraceae bacterium]